MHWGETKTWYGIAGSDAEKFENAMKSAAPDLFEQQPSLLYQLVTMMNPGSLRKVGVPVTACDQRPNEFVVTFPKAYHCGFNQGVSERYLPDQKDPVLTKPGTTKQLNYNEAVNFALPDWLNLGYECIKQYQSHAKAPVFSHEELLITMSQQSDSIETAVS